MSDLVCVACNVGKALLPESIGAQLCKQCYIDDRQSVPVEPSVSKPSEAMVTEDGPSEPEASSSGTQNQEAMVVDVPETSSAPAEKREVGRWTRLRTKTPMGPPPPPPVARGIKRKIVPQGTGRRTLFKSTPRKSPSNTATIITSDQVYHEGRLMVVGDVVSMTDDEEDTYYAQLRGFVIDEYLEKSAVVTWLLPTTASPPPSQSFDPTTYIIGPEENLPRKLAYMEYVMHLDINYYKSSSPYPMLESQRVANATGGFIWTSLHPVDRSG